VQQLGRGGGGAQGGAAFGRRGLAPDGVVGARVLEEDGDVAAGAPAPFEIGGAVAVAAEAVAEQDHRHALAAGGMGDAQRDGPVARGIRHREVVDMVGGGGLRARDGGVVAIAVRRSGGQQGWAARYQASAKEARRRHHGGAGVIPG
jgi:hypothetical protein